MQELDGEVKRVEPFGLFVQLSGSITTGLVHVSEISDKRIHRLEASYPVGRKVRVAVLAIDEAKGRLSLGMKDKYFTGKAHKGDADADEYMEDMQDAEASDRAGVLLLR
jgi:ribosomal protein S1